MPKTWYFLGTNPVKKNNERIVKIECQNHEDGDF